MTPKPTIGAFGNEAVDRQSLPRPRARRHLTLRFSERKLVLATFDLVLLNLMFYTVLNLRARGDASFGWNSGGSPLGWFALLSLLYFGCALIIGGYDLVRAANVQRSLSLCAGAIGLAWVLFLSIPFLTPPLPQSRLHLLLFPILSLLAMGAWRVFYATVFGHPNFQQRALIIGAGGAGQTLANAIGELSQRARSKTGADEAPVGSSIGYRVLGFIDDGVERGSLLENVPVVGTRHDLTRLSGQLHVNELVVAITHLETMDVELFEAIQECREWGVSITTMTDLYERLTGRIAIEHAGRALAVAMPVVQRPTHRFYLALQRIVDVLGALVGCVLLGLIIPFVWLANRLKSPGPLFYAQERVGKGGSSFQILKFRSMRTDAEKFGAVWAEENDPRITPVGRFLRGTRLDEIPQFWNILKGDMSLIGPRPERPHFVSQLTREIPFYRVRHAVKPGLTGWAQVRYRYGASVEDSLIKLQYDLFYIKRQSLLLDLEIVFKTIPIIVGFKGR
jgi:exopolysaccharide biosynthesis polyprenyl glycosylphosphotransferase